MVDHVPIMRLKGVITGKLGKKEISEQRSENEGLTGGERIYFGWRGLTRDLASALYVGFVALDHRFCRARSST
jgi:hypothetical protein